MVGKGEDHPYAKLTKKKVLYARRIYRPHALPGSGFKDARTLAKELNVGTSTMHQMLNRKTWKSVGEE